MSVTFAHGKLQSVSWQMRLNFRALVACVTKLSSWRPGVSHPRILQHGYEHHTPHPTYPPPTPLQQAGVNSNVVFIERNKERKRERMTETKEERKKERKKEIQKERKKESNKEGRKKERSK